MTEKVRDVNDVAGDDRRHRRKDRSSRGGSKGGSKTSSSGNSGGKALLAQREASGTLTPKTTTTAEEEIYQIVATESSRDRMRKISGVTDPGDAQYGYVVATETAHDRMRKMSKLGLEDPVDNITSNNVDGGGTKNPTSRTEALRQSERERAATERERTQTANRTSRSSGRHKQQGRRSRDESPAQPNRMESRDPSSKQTNNSSDNNQSVDKKLSKSSQDSKQPNQQLRGRPRRSQSDSGKDHGASPMLDSNLRPVVITRRKTRGRSLDDMDELFQDMQDKEAGAPANPEPGPATTVRIGQMIAPTAEEKQLMRKISALGLEDPVFGKVHEDMAINHASMIFEDMMLDDIPTDMRDMLSVVSDKTDTVHLADDDLFKVEEDKPSNSSKPASSKSLMTNNNSRFHDSSAALVYEPDFVPPVGSFIRKESKRNLMSKDPSNRGLMSKEKSNRNMNSMNNSSTPQSPGISPEAQKPTSSRSNIGQKQRPTMTRSTPAAVKTTSSDDDELDNFIPPSGSFRIRSPRKKVVPHASAAASANPRGGRRGGSGVDKTETLMQSIIQQKQKEEKVKAALGRSMPDLSDSDFNASYCDDSVKPRSLRSAKSASKVVKKKMSVLRSVPHEEYVPPPAPFELAPAPPELVAAKTTGGMVEHRALPSMEFCFTPRGGVRKKTAHELKSMERMNQLRKGLSTRSCDDDLGLHDSPPTEKPAFLKASPDSVLNAPLSPLSSSKGNTSKGASSSRKRAPAVPRPTRPGVQ